MPEASSEIGLRDLRADEAEVADARMEHESSGVGLMAVHAETLELQLLARGSDAARQRFRHLRRLLFLADIARGCGQRRPGGRRRARIGHAGAAAGRRRRGRVARRRVPVRTLREGGPARMGQRRQRGAAARADLPRGLVADVRAARLDGPRAARGGRVLRRDRLRHRSPASPAPAPASAAHRAPKLRQRTLIVGSGLVAEPARRAHQRPSRARPRRSPASSTTAPATWAPAASLPRRPERAQRPRRARPRRPRDDRLHARPPRGAAARAARLPRRRRGRRHRPAAVRVPRRRPLDRADRRDAAALDRRADASPRPRA